jgi:hypothetical protein
MKRTQAGDQFDPCTLPTDPDLIPNFSIAKFATQGSCGPVLARPELREGQGQDKPDEDFPALSRETPLAFPGPNPRHALRGRGRGKPGFFVRTILCSRKIWDTQQS